MSLKSPKTTIDQLREQRAARKIASDLAEHGHDIERLRIPETPGYFIPFCTYGVPLNNITATNPLLIAPVHRPCTLLSFRVSAYHFGAQSVANHWDISLYDNIGTLCTYSTTTHPSPGWTGTSPVTTFTRSEIGVPSIYFYVDIAAIGTPGTVSLAISLYVV